MAMRILMIGDVVGRPGRRVVWQQLPGLIERYGADVVIANGENAAGGSGLTPKLLDKLRGYGVDGVTLGDHAFRKGEILPALAGREDVIRPANLPAGSPSRGTAPPGIGAACASATPRAPSSRPAAKASGWRSGQATTSDAHSIQTSRGCATAPWAAHTVGGCAFDDRSARSCRYC